MAKMNMYDGHDEIGCDGKRQNTAGQDVMGPITTGHKGQAGRDRTDQYRTGRDGMGLFLMGLSFNSYLGCSIVLCMYVKLYYLLVTDLSEK